MPYIAPHRRTQAVQDEPGNVGELTYALTMVCVAYMGTPVFARIAEVVGALECAKQEFYRRVAAEYENKKCLENGDVF